MNKKTNVLVVSCLLLMSIMFAGGCSSGGAGSGNKPVSIAVSPLNRSIAAGNTQQFTAIGTYANGTTQDLTTSATWSSSDSSCATTSNSAGSNGKVTGLAPGATTITATYGLISDSTTLTVTSATLTSIAVTPTNPSMAAQTTQQFTATGTYSDNSTQDLTKQVTWSSSDPSITTIDSEGNATALAAGTTTITATQGPVSGTTTLPVSNATLSSITVTPINQSIAAGTTQQFTATGTFSDNTNQDLTAQVTWNSSDTSKASIAASGGLARAVAAGPTTITATLGTTSGTTTLLVSTATLSSIVVTPDNQNIAARTTQQFTATGFYSDSTSQDLTTSVTWNSSTPSIATISNAAGSNGEATGLSVGVTTITATYGSISGSTPLTVKAPASQSIVSIAVTPSNPIISAIPAGTTFQFTATGTFSDNTTQDLTMYVSWKSSNGNASIDAKGKATTAAAGTTTITATSEGIQGSATLTITNAALISIAVTPNNPSVTNWKTQQFTATGTYSDATTQDLTALVSWNSSDRSVASFYNSAGSIGLATALTPGSTTISAASGSITGSSILKVESAN